MSLLDKLLGRAPVDPNARVHVAVPLRPFVNTHALDAAGLRRGMWVMSAAGIGILTGARIDGMAEITLQKQDGTTRMELDANDQAVPALLIADMGTLRAAFIEEVPDTRHEGADHLRSFGYINASEA